MKTPRRWWRPTTMIIFLTSTMAFGLESSPAVGTYELTGVMEMAGRLEIKKDRTYIVGFSYGAADWQEEGTWKLEGNEMVLHGGRFRIKNALVDTLFLPAGTRFTVQPGKLTATDPKRKLIWIDPNQTPSPQNPTADSAGEGRMRVRGKVIRLDAEVLVVQKKECIQFAVGSLSDSILRTARQNIGKAIDVEIPFSAIIGGGSCP